MPEYWTGSRDDEFKDVLSEIDAGEVDERYLVKHAGDYCTLSGLHPLCMVQTGIANLLNRLRADRREGTSPWNLESSRNVPAAQSDA